MADQRPALSDGAWSRRVLVGDSVFEDAQVTIRDGVLYIEFEADDLGSISLDLKTLTS